MPKNFHHPQIGLSLLAAALLGASTAAHAQVQPSTGIQVPHTPYNDLVTQVHQGAAKVFASPEGRKANAADLLQAVSRLAPLVQKAIDQPGAEMVGMLDATIIAHLKATPAEAQELRQIHTSQLRVLNIFRLALDEPLTASANQSQRTKSGPTAANATFDRAAADWLTASDAPSQGAAFDALRLAATAGADTPMQLWSSILDLRPPATATLATTILNYLRPHASDHNCFATLLQLQTQVRHSQIEGAALTLQGTAVQTAKQVSTAQWKGKVVLIHIYDIACPGSDQQVSQYQNLLAAQHAAGLELLEIAHAPNLDALKKFLTAHPTFTAPQVYRGPLPPRHIDAPSAKLDPTAAAGVLIIDRKGIAHVIDAEPAELNPIIARFLAEKP